MGRKEDNSYSGEDKENLQNDKLLQRLTKVAVNHGDVSGDKSKMTSVMMGNKSHIGEKSSISVTHEEWIRRKEHETKLKEQLIREAKKDMLENMRKKQSEEIQKKEEREL